MFRTKYRSPERPYSQNELREKIRQTFDKLRIDNNHMILHPKCEHFYFCKVGSQKKPTERNCSICWKYKKTPDKFKDDINELIEAYERCYEFDFKRISHFQGWLNTTFYEWLYGNNIKSYN